MDSITSEGGGSSRDNLGHLSEEAGPVEHHFRSLAEESAPQEEQQQQPSDSSSDVVPSRSPFTISLSLLPSQIGAAQSQTRGRSLRSRRLRRGYHLTSSGERIRDIVRSRPRCGVLLLRSLRNDKLLCVPEARSDPEKPQRCPGRADKLFIPKDGDLLMHHEKKLGKRVVEFFDAEQPQRFEEGDYLLRFKVDNYSFMHQSFVTVRGYLYHHGNWMYLGKDSDQMELA